MNKRKSTFNNEMIDVDVDEGVLMLNSTINTKGKGKEGRGSQLIARYSI